ncbi:MAG: radical SAM protein [Bacteroidales bacterium]|nr:radical SAM protein [Bacteroidales bacterium]
MITNPVLLILIKASIRLNMLWLIFSVYQRPGKIRYVFKRIISIKRSEERNRKVKKFALKGNRLFMAINIPGWPSRQFNKFIKNEILRLENSESDKTRLQTVFFETTGKCRLNCKHCSNAGNHNNNGKARGEVLENILLKVKDEGIPHIQFTGGEPLEDFDMLLKLIRRADRMDTWVLSSGFELTKEKARALKKAGLVGVNISLDHWNEQEHNKFRGNDEAFSWAKRAILNCKNEGLLISISLCATKEFTTEENLAKFLELSKKMRVHFIRILEPKQTGLYLKGDNRLSLAQLQLLEDFFFSDICNRNDKTTPILMYPDLMNREKCIGKGDRYLYINMDGLVHPCPFSFTGTNNILELSFKSINNDLSKEDCINCNVYKGSLN